MTPKPRKNLPTLGERIRLIAKALGTQAEAAKRAGVSLRQMQKYVANKAQPPPNVLGRLAVSAGFNLEWLVSGAGEARWGEPLPSGVKVDNESLLLAFGNSPSAMALVTDRLAQEGHIPVSDPEAAAVAMKAEAKLERAETVVNHAMFLTVLSAEGIDLPGSDAAALASDLSDLAMAAPKEARPERIAYIVTWLRSVALEARKLALDPHVPPEIRPVVFAVQEIAARHLKSTRWKVIDRQAAKAAGLDALSRLSRDYARRIGEPARPSPLKPGKRGRS